MSTPRRKRTLAEADHHTGLWAWKHPHGDGTVTYTKLAGRVVFDHVDFGYTPDKEVLHDITLYAEPGQKVAFVGATGAGKTTITNLINRFYDIADGKIRYDGININKIRKADLRRSLGIVLQDVNLFTGTVMENIRYGNPAATDDECIAAAKLANADHFIRMLPDGYNTVLKGDGSGLSQGQRQLLSIARAAVSDPPVMILDEATSSIDTRTEALVQSGMDKLMEGARCSSSRTGSRRSRMRTSSWCLTMAASSSAATMQSSSPKRACTTSSIPARRARIISCAPLRPAGGRGIIAVTKQRRRTMEYRRFGNTIVARIDRGEEVLEQVAAIAQAEQIKLASVQALGAVGEFTVGVFHTAEKQYHANSFAGDFEIVSLTGTINTMDGAFYTHLHMSAGNEKAKCSADISTARYQRHL